MTDIVEEIARAMKPELFQRYPNGQSPAHNETRRMARAAYEVMARGDGELNCEELAILHGQQVTVTFKDNADAFALFNELKRRAGPALTQPSVRHGQEDLGA
jgi:hypothetical protein